jgi:mono/diheme cytochrome c family protein
MRPLTVFYIALAQTNCSQCHAIGRVGDSPIPEAPPFRTLHTRHPIEDLAQASRKASQFQLDPAQINDLLAYLDSAQA